MVFSSVARLACQTSHTTTIPATGMRSSQTGCVCEWHLKTTNLELLSFSCVLLSAGVPSTRVVTGQEQLSLWTLFVCHPAEVRDDPLLVGSVSMRVSTLLEIEDTTCCCKFTSPPIYKSLVQACFCTRSNIFNCIPASQEITALLHPTLDVSAYKRHKRKFF